MNVDFMHNQIVRDTITPKFIESFNENLVPYLISEYGSALEEIQFYEDHLTSGLRINGEFHYPLTLVVDGRSFTRWVKWQVSNYRNYDKFNPYTYKGSELLEFELLNEVSADLKAVVAGKPIYSEDTAMTILLTSAAEDKTFLSGKYSQGFVDALAHSVTELIETEFGIRGLSESGVVLELRFAPGTFMEHIVENTTYRRLLIKARGCSARDLWVKWTRLDGRGTYTVSDNVSSDDVMFELAEDVPGKIREKEYRFLTAESTDKYQAAMGRKNITEWREMMRRVIRRGEVSKLAVSEELTLTVTETAEEELKATVPEAPAYIPEVVTVDPIDDLIAAKEESKDALSAILAQLDADEAPENDEMDDDLADLLKTAIGITSAPVSVSEPVVDEEEEEEELPEEDVEEEEIEEEYEEEIEDEPVRVATASVSEDKARLELEQKIRAELEEELRRKHEEAEELRARLEAQLRAETREKELMAEAARAAILEQQRLAKEREAAEARAREEAARRIEEEKRAAEETRIARARADEEARIRAEMEARERARLAAEAEAAAKRAAEEAAEKAKESEAKYVSKVAKLLFKHSVDGSITKRIHEIILATIKYYHKEDVYIKIKATVPDSTTVNLEFVKIPEDEIPLLVNIIKVLGRSDLGITKAILD